MWFHILTVINTCLIFHHRTSASDVTSLFNGIQNHPNWKLLPLENCGEGGTLPNIDTKVIGGSKAGLGQFPWMANLFRTYERQNNSKHDCGGSIINERYILSAAHCCSPLKPKESWIRVGEYNLTNDGIECTPAGCVDSVQNISVESFKLHENYTSFLKDDICLLRLTHPIKFTEYVHPVCLPAHETLMNKSFAGENMQIAGWGSPYEFYQSPSPILLTAGVPVVPEKDCQKLYSALGTKKICAGGYVNNTMHQICRGDSGGPLMKEVEVEGRKRYFVFGIASYSRYLWLINLCVKVPGVFTRVTSYLDWILDNLEP